MNVFAYSKLGTLIEMDMTGSGTNIDRNAYLRDNYAATAGLATRTETRQSAPLATASTGLHPSAPLRWPKINDVS